MDSPSVCILARVAKFKLSKVAQTRLAACSLSTLYESSLALLFLREPRGICEAEPGGARGLVRPRVHERPQGLRQAPRLYILPNSNEMLNNLPAESAQSKPAEPAFEVSFVQFALPCSSYLSAISGV